MDMPLIKMRAVEGPAEGQTWQSSVALRVGRLPCLEMMLDDASVSRRHAEVVLTDKGWVARDLGSTNGTFVNAARLGPGEETMLRGGDLVQFGTACLLVEAADIPSGPSREAVVDRMVLAAAVRHSLEEATGLLVEECWQRPVKQIVACLARVGRGIGRGTSLNDGLRSALWEAVEVLEAAQGVLLLWDRKANAPRAQASFDVSGGSGDGLWARLSPLALRALGEGDSMLYQARTVPASLDEDGPASLICAALRLPGEVLGVLCLARGPDQNAFGNEDLILAEALALAVAPDLDGVARLLDRQQEQLLQTLSVLADLSALRDEGAGGRARRVTEYALLLAEELGLSEADRRLLRAAAPLHELGRLGVRDATLEKPGPLTPEEMGQIRTGLARATALMESSPALAPLAAVVRSQRERWDGGGYPDRLAGESIPLAGRLLAVAAAFEAMTNGRPYRPALSPAETFSEMAANAGTQFDPRCVDALLKLRPRLEEAIVQRKLAEGTLSRQELTNVLESLRLGPRLARPGRRDAPPAAAV